MPTAYVLRFCICSLLFTLVIESSAQRRAARRSVPKTEEIQLQEVQVEEEVIDAVEKNLDLKKMVNPKSGEETTIPFCRETNGINKTKVADSYPYITEDGLRLYFTSNREGGHGRFFISTRQTVNDPFGEPKVLSSNLTDGFYAGTLTADELTLCLVNEGSMYISIRADKNRIFPAPVKLNGATDNYHFGPSISADGKEIFVTVTIDGKDRTRVYKRTGTYMVEKIGELSLPKDGDAGPGQLSKDGLSYYVSIEINNNEYLWRYSRKTTADDFGDPAELPQQIQGLHNIIQPSVSGDGSVLVFVTSPDNSWDDDDILLVNTAKKLGLPKLPTNLLADADKLPAPIKRMNSYQLIDYSTTIKDQNTKELANESKANTRKVTSTVSVFQSKVYPNPFTTVINVELNALPADGALFYLYDESSRLIKQQKVNNMRTTISFNRSLPGSYTYQVTDSKGNLIASGQLIKVQ